MKKWYKVEQHSPYSKKYDVWEGIFSPSKDKPEGHFTRNQTRPVNRVPLDRVQADAHCARKNEAEHAKEKPQVGS